MIKLIPNSLFGRLMAVFLVGLVIAQFLSIYIVFLDRGQLLYQSIQSNLISKTAGIIKLLNNVNDEQQKNLLKYLSNENLQIYVIEKPIKNHDEQTSTSTAAKLVKKLLQKRLPKNTPVLVSLSGYLMQNNAMQEHMSQMMSQTSQHTASQHSMAHSFHIQIQLKNGHWILFEQGIKNELFEWPIKLLSVLLVLLSSVIILSTIAVRLIITPLKNLRIAAEGLGKDVLQEPLSEEGPEEVKQTAIAFNTMQKRLRSYIEDRTHILSAISHDLKTPLTRLRLRAELLDDKVQREKTLKDLSDMESMINATLDFMKGIANNEKNKKIDMTALLESIQADAEESGHTVQLSITENTVLNAKPIALKRCIENLLTNALRYAQDVSLTLEQTSDNVVISICDRGPGIAEADLEKIFEPFYRIESSRAQNTGGTGLGLGIAKNIAKAHGGNIILYNRKGGGLCAEIILPTSYKESN